MNLQRLAFLVLVASFSLATASSASAAVPLPTGEPIAEVDFERHVMGLLGRAGCNGGSCHGSFQGKGGFRLTLFGYEPAKDFFAITRDNLGRRVNPADPDSSLFLLKATGQVEHAGGMRFSKGSWQYQLIREWLANGAPWRPGSGTVQSIRIHPPELAFAKAGEQRQLQIKAQFADDSIHDITALCDFRTNDDAVADVDSQGRVRSVRPGSTSIIVSYRGNVLPVNVLIPMELPAGVQYPKVAETNYIDREIFARLRQLNMIPSELSSDEEFLRRVTIDTTGQLPSPAEVRTFLADNRPDKRARKIDELLAHPLHAAMWATKFSDITGNDTLALENPQQTKAKRSQMWHDWFSKRVQENMPYDQLVKGVLTATSRDNLDPVKWLEQVKTIDQQAQKGTETDYARRESLDLYWRRQQNQTIEQWGERTAAAFMGVRLECAQCHKHPFDRWTQVDYRAYANVFASLSFGASPETKKVIDAENAERKKKNPKNNQFQVVKEVYIGNPTKPLSHPDTGAPLGAKAPGGPDIKLVKGQDPRAALFEWLRDKDNPFFSRSFVNRVWGHYLGQGIVHPVDDFSLANPPSNEKLLNALAKDFLDHNFDIRHIERTILNSRTYQLSSKANDTNKLDKNNFARSYVRPMMAEAVVDVLNSALGAAERFGPEVRTGSKAVEVGASQLPNPTLTYAFRIFGRPPRTSACDCERAMEPALPQKLFLMTDPQLLAKFNDPQGRLQKLLAAKMSDAEVHEELYLATLSRLPRAEEKEAFAEHRQRVSNRREAFTDLMWALINTREFILNH